jgi:uncharacterized circularly permuted ATP-grasp superfamily protein/uncharacterized alpha-E superfamily protein
MQLDDYEPGAFHDEMFEASGAPRPGCQILAERLVELRDGEAARRQRAAERALLAMGITFNVYGEAEGTERIFPYDLVPRVVEGAEWTRIEAGLKQRIRALNAFLSDVYGPQRALADGVIPREVVESSNGYLPQCQGLEPPGGVWIHVTGTDLVRGADGTFYVLEDNLRCPSGVSYVLANRAIMKRVYPRAFSASQVQPVDVYPARLLATLQQVAPEGVSAPTIVVLTPGIHNSAYYEHAFLAQAMGVELVEGQDLVVEGQAVHMRTTAGLKRVDVIYRRIDDAFLDPKAFHPDSLLGVPGLMEVYRRGGVSLANAPGTGVADDKVVYAYVPRLIRYYLGEDPLLPNVPTYLCREDEARAEVLDRLDELVVKDANGAGGYGMLIGPSSTPEERAAFAKRIEARPRDYIAQPVIQLSRVPTLVDEERLEGRHVDLRPYILYGDDVYVLPGGLTRVALRKGSLVVNSSQGGGSKDTWVLRDEGEGEPARVSRPSPKRDRGGEGAVLSRVADALHWMSRYVERAENVARFVDVNLALTLDRPAGAEDWAPIVATTGDDAWFAERYGEATRENALRFLLFDRDYPNSVARCFRAARENARAIRPILSSETWEELNQAYLTVLHAPRDEVLEAPIDFLRHIRKDSHAFIGTMELTMRHNEAYHFARLGRLLERADKTSRILDVKYFLLPEEDAYDDLSAQDELEWAALLRSSSALEAYRKTFGRIAPKRVLCFLMQQRDFPRSLLFCLAEAETSLRRVAGSAPGQRGTEAEQRLGRLKAELEFEDVADVLEAGLHERLDHVQSELNEIAAALDERFFRGGPVEPTQAQTQSQGG